MRNGILICVLLWSGLSVSLLAQQESTAPILAAMQRIDPSIKSVVIGARVAGSDDKDLVLVEGSAKPEGVRYADGSFAWGVSDTLSLISQDRGGNHDARIVKAFRRGGGKDDGCCSVRVLRATSTEIVLSRDGEKFETRPNLKLMIDAKTGTVTTSEYLPFSAQGTRIDSGIPTFVVSDGNQFLAIHAIGMAPYLELMPGRATPPNRAVTSVPSAIFGARSPKLPQSTYDEFAAARPSRVADGFDRAGTKINETIGPVQIIGSRAWFGKSFYDGESQSGVGAFGYLDSNEGKYHLYSPPEIRDWSVSAIRVEGEVAWLGLTSMGEGAETSGGVLRVDLQTTQVRKYKVDGTVNEFVRYENRMYLATSRGVSVVLPDDSVQQAFIDMAADKTYQLNSTTP